MSYLSLRQPVIAPVKTTILGQDVYIRRLSSDEQNNYIETTQAQTDKGMSDRDVALMGVNLLLSALVNPDGTQPAKKDLPRAEELLAVHSNGDLLDAINIIQRNSWGTLKSVEDAKKN